MFSNGDVVFSVDSVSVVDTGEWRRTALYSYGYRSREFCHELCIVNLWELMSSCLLWAGYGYLSMK